MMGVPRILPDLSFLGQDQTVGPSALVQDFHHHVPENVLTLVLTVHPDDVSFKIRDENPFLHGYRGSFGNDLVLEFNPGRVAPWQDRVHEHHQEKAADERKGHHGPNEDPGRKTAAFQCHQLPVRAQAAVDIQNRDEEADGKRQHEETGLEVKKQQERIEDSHLFDEKKIDELHRIVKQIEDEGDDTYRREEGWPKCPKAIPY